MRSQLVRSSSVYDAAGVVAHAPANNRSDGAAAMKMREGVSMLTSYGLPESLYARADNQHLPVCPAVNVRFSVYRGRIANRSIFDDLREKRAVLANLTQNCKIADSMQSHCRGQGFDSPQLHQPLPLMNKRKSKQPPKVRRRTSAALCKPDR